ncbi:NADH dehydrogenase [ubiquinone] iron-sulfur mitochondrial [Micractinium conductrix]|uniref:NADH dehydrogenase [ubiquinone] iron-sulfur mitochondrial n=1 Tax=Micractinium conductrix TaxID=554055 RepID=A0A2P6V2D6_9CHLO|nr:NADH dehydrogenase [ubiquinone] iron-sulfur mitochondrial [Micractinium conductrix]|eukprot:PSC68241.1 NADH dehydrogenase [ubiquinone] iron-sulfur mitochondrial [Micractinium conductrix]
MLARRLAAQAPAWAAAAAAAVGARGAATKAVSKAGAPSPSTEVGKDDITTTLPGQAFVGDLRSTSALCVGDGITTHTAKWLQGNHRSPLEYIQAAEPMKVHGLVVASNGSNDPALGCPVEYINLKGTTRENPAVCKYTGNKYYSDDWVGGGAH